MSRKSPVTQADLDTLRSSCESVLHDLNSVTQQAESAGVDCPAPLSRIVSLIALSEAAAALAKVIAGRCAIAEDRRELEAKLRREIGA